MIGILIIILFSWGFLYYFQKTNLRVLGFTPGVRIYISTLKAFLFSAILCTTILYLQSLMLSSTFALNEDVVPFDLITSIWWDIKSVLTEELIFRGALLYLLIRKIGKPSIFLSAIAFGVYHWFSMGVFGSIIPMIVIFIGTGIMGYAWALSFYKSKSILLPFALHLGWNVIHNTIFSKGPLGNLLFISNDVLVVEGIIAQLNFLLPMFAAPLIMLLYVRYALKNNGKWT